jgi:hypothetical protein
LRTSARIMVVSRLRVFRALGTLCNCED